MTDESRAEFFTDRVMTLVEHIGLSMDERALMRITLVFAYLRGYSECRWRQLCEEWMKVKGHAGR